jgi:hypothetical protein
VSSSMPDSSGGNKGELVDEQSRGFDSGSMDDRKTYADCKYQLLKTQQAWTIQGNTTAVASRRAADDLSQHQISYDEPNLTCMTRLHD